MSYGLNAVLKQASNQASFSNDAVLNPSEIQPPACDGAPSTR